MKQGWIKLWRKSLGKEWLQNHKLWAFWCWCLMKATHKDHKQIVGCQEIHLSPGQFIFGRNQAAKELKMSVQNIRTFIIFLRSTQNITIKTTNKYSIITIVNWHTYQSDEPTTNQLTNKRLTNNQPTTNQQLTTNKNIRIKEIKNKNTYNTLREYLLKKISDSGLVLSKEKVLEFFEYRMHKPKKEQYKTEKGIDGLFRDLNSCRDAGLNIQNCIDIAMERDWLTPDAKYFQNKIKMTTHFPNNIPLEVQDDIDRLNKIARQKREQGD